MQEKQPPPGETPSPGNLLCVECQKWRIWSDPKPPRRGFCKCGSQAPVTSDFPAELAALRAGALLAGVVIGMDAQGRYVGREIEPSDERARDNARAKLSTLRNKLQAFRGVSTPQHSFAIGGSGSELTAVVKLFPQEGAPIVRAMVVDRTKRGTSVHFEAAADGTLLVRLTDV